MLGRVGGVRSSGETFAMTSRSASFLDWPSPLLRSVCTQFRARARERVLRENSRNLHKTAGQVSTPVISDLNVPVSCFIDAARIIENRSVNFRWASDASAPFSSKRIHLRHRVSSFFRVHRDSRRERKSSRTFDFQELLPRSWRAFFYEKR